jgi:beta-glucanase (GH16 family)
MSRCRNRRPTATSLASRLIYLLVTVVLVLCSCSFQANAMPEAVFDDFDGPAGSPPNPALWGYDLGKGLGNINELENYTNSSENVRLDGQGHLVIQAHKSSAGYTSGRVVTRGKLNMLYGTLTARIKFPVGQGIWPAFWLVGADEGTVGWPRSGEIDLMELVNEGTTYNVTLHGPQGDSDYLDGAGFGTSGHIADLSTDFHDYWMHWLPDSITIGVDDATLGAFTPRSLPDGAQWVFDHPMYALLNVAVGGDWPGLPTDATPFPATMLVDWFRYTPEAD